MGLRRNPLFPGGVFSEREQGFGGRKRAPLSHRKAAEAEPAAPSDSRVGKVVKVVVSDRKKKAPAKKPKTEE